MTTRTHRIAAALLLTTSLCFTAEAQTPKRIACIGDSITYGHGIRDRKMTYPAQLERLMGEGCTVGNFGVSARTLLKKGDHPIWREKKFQQALAFRPDAVLIKLGTNDTKPHNWKHKDELAGDLKEMIGRFAKLPSKPTVYVCLPVPAFPERWGIRDSVIREELIPILRRVATAEGAEVIDLYGPLSGKKQFFPDKVHPNAEGAGLMAKEIHRALTGGADRPAAGGGDRLIELTLTDPKRKRTVPVKIWIPGGVEVLRGLIVQGLYDGLVKRTDYRQLARTLRFGLVGAMMRKSEPLLPGALKQFAAMSGHPEIEHCPWVTMGFSAGGGVAIKLAVTFPGRVIAVVSNGNPGAGFKIDDPAQVAALRKIPVLTVNGSKDPFVDYDKAPERYWHNAHHTRLRARRLPWGLAMQWGRGHDYANTNALAWPFLVEAIRLRLGDRTAEAGPVKLRDVPEAAGLLGDITTWEGHWATVRPFSRAQAERTTNTWLLNEHVARLWRAFVSKSPPVRVTVAADPKSPGRHVVSLEGQVPAGTRKVAFYSGATLLGESEAAPYEVRTAEIARGVHSVFAVCLIEGGGRVVTNPLLRIGGEDPKRDAAEKAAK